MTQHYVDQNNQIHELEDAEFAYLLPPGCSPISEEEADAIREAAKAEKEEADEAVRLAAIPPFNLSTYRTGAQARVDAHYETLYRSSVANSAIAAEYQAAYASAVAWLVDPILQPAPERVKALAETYGVSNLLAANVVVQKWNEAQSVAFDRRGAARLRAKLAVRTAVDKISVDAAEDAGKLAMASVVFSV